MQNMEEEEKTKKEEEGKNEILKLPDNYITHCLKYDLIKSMQNRDYAGKYKNNTDLEVLSEKFDLNNVESIEFTLDMTGDDDELVNLKIDNHAELQYRIVQMELLSVNDFWFIKDELWRLCI